MNWKKKDKSAWAFLVPEISDYEFLPLHNLIGKTALEYLFKLNYYWQKDNLKYIQKMVSEPCADHPTFYSSGYDFFIYSKKNSKKDINKEFDGFNIHLKKKNPVLGDKARLKINLTEIPGSDNSSAGKLKAVFQELMEYYNMVTVWNLESLSLEPAHFSQVLSATVKSNVLCTITGFQNRLVLISCNLKNLSSHVIQNEYVNKEFEIRNSQISSLFDLSSIHDTICDFEKINSPVTISRARELAQALKSIGQNLP